MRLGTLLLRDAAVSLGQLEAALHSQVLHGGRLGTHLVALGFLSLDELARYLSEMLGVPFATEQMFAAVPPAILADFDAALAARCEAFPLGYLPRWPEMLAVAMASPGDLGVVAQVERALARPIVPHVAPELRIRSYLQRCYGLSAGPARAAPGAVAGGAADAGTPAARAIYEYEEAAAAMDGATSRERVGDALIGFAASRFAAAVVFIVRGGEAGPWRVHGAAGALPALSLSTPSVLQVAYDGGVPHRGPAPDVHAVVERVLWEALGVAREPREMLVAPVLVGRRVVQLVYAHAVDGEAVDETAAGQLADLAARAGRAYARMLQGGDGVR